MPFLQHPVGFKSFEKDYCVRRLAAKWCTEPSLHGGKTRPKSTKYVELRQHADRISFTLSRGRGTKMERVRDLGSRKYG